MSNVGTPYRAQGVVPAHVQAGFDVGCEWGLQGIEALAPTSDVVVVVDVLSFTTCVEVATANGATVLPHRRCRGQYRGSDTESRTTSRIRGDHRIDRHVSQ